LAREWGDIAVTVALISNNKTQFFTQGHDSNQENGQVNKHSQFEIGSLSKPLTALLSATLVQNQTWQLSNSIDELLDAQSTNQHQYTLAQLLTHRSGLPRLPQNLTPSNMNDPYADYNVIKLRDALKASPNEATNYVYSNYGYGLLGWLAASQLQTAYPDSMQREIFAPLNMTQSYVATPESTKDVLQGHNAAILPVANWTFDSLAGAGGVVASIEGVSNWISSYWDNQHLDKTMQASLALSLTPLAETKPVMAWGWFIKNNNVYWHNGQTAGFSSVAIFDPSAQKSVIILSAKVADVTRLGFALFEQLD